MKLKSCLVGMTIVAKADFSISNNDVVSGHRSTNPDATYRFIGGNSSLVLVVEDTRIIVESFGCIFKTDPKLWKKVVDTRH